MAYHMRLYLVAFAFLCVASKPKPVCAAAWTQAKGEHLLIASYRFYQAQSFFDVDRQKQPKNGRFSKDEWQLYHEYGWRDGVTLGKELAFSRQRDVQRDVFARTPEDRLRIVEFSGITQAEYFATIQLWRDDEWAVALQPRIGIPSYFFDDPPDDLVTDNFSVQMAASVGHNFTLMETTGHFFDMSAAYRHRTGQLLDQYMLHVVAGLKLNDDWMLLPEIHYTGASGAIDRNIMTITGQNDYELTKMQGTIRYQWLHDVAVQIGGFAHIDGMNTGGGGGALVSVWLIF
ncbi:MAG: hypothetical protein EAY65_04330 [Alphaproteobacteria bacterium]|nr:MAG: hypothetical protein EAY65_04330 [Alphaproteobacteria bacterium]